MLSKQKLNFDSLTSGEVLWLLRKRAGTTQHQAAVNFSLTRHEYADMERDALASEKKELPHGLLDHERCMIYRRRAGSEVTQANIANTINLSRAWVIKMEQGKVDPAKLLEYWETKYG